MITIKKMELDNDSALKLIKLIKKHEPEIWKVFRPQLKQALNIACVVNCSTCSFESFGSLQTPCVACKEHSHYSPKSK